MVTGNDHIDIWEFTPRQRDIVARLLRGTSPKQIAMRLSLGVRTVYWHVENIYRRVGVHSLGEFFAWAHTHRDCCRVGLIWDSRRRSAG